MVSRETTAPEGAGHAVPLAVWRARLMVALTVLIVLATNPWQWVARDRAILGFETNYSGEVTSVLDADPPARPEILKGDRVRWDQSKFGVAGDGLLKFAENAIGTRFDVHVLRNGSPRTVTTRIARDEPLSPLLRLLSIGEFLTFLAFMVVATIVIVYRPSVTATWLYLYSILSVPTDGLLTGYTWLPNAQFSITWVVVTALANLWANVPLLPFVVAFPDDARITQHPLLYRAALALSGATLVASFIIAGGAARGNEFLGSLILHRGGAIIGLIATVPALAILGTNYVRSQGADRQRLRWAVVGIAVSAAASVAIYQDIGETWQDLLFIATIAMPVMLAYAILHDHVIDLRIVADWAVLYGVVTVLLVFAFGTIHWAALRLLGEQHLADIVDLCAAVVLGFALERMHAGIVPLIERLIFRERHRARRYLSRLARRLPFAHSETVVRDSLVHQPVGLMRLAGAVLYVRDPLANLFRVTAQSGINNNLADLPLDDELVAFLRADPVVTRMQDVPLTKLKQFSLAIPVRVRNDVEAFVAYGIHEDGSDLEPAEVRLLEALGRGASAAVDHLESLRVKEENRELRRDVESALFRAAELERLIMGTII